MIKIGDSAQNISVYTCQPKDNEELREIIEERVYEEGPNCDLNDIDVSKIIYMSYLFYGLDFNGNISKWDVSNAKNMANMFAFSKFNGDISRWNVSKVENMLCMFYKSSFNGDISDWDVSSVENMSWMFTWTKFNQDISKWNINKDCYVDSMFCDCPIKKEYKLKSLQQI